MEYTTEFDVCTFSFWGPAKAIVDEIRHAHKLDELQEVIETAFYDEIPSKTTINDFVWEESSFILKTIGLRKNEGEYCDED